MSSKVNTQIERETMMLWNGDGLADVVFGFGICLAGVLMLLGISHAMLAAWIPAMFLKWFKDRVSVPRMGYVTFRPSFSIKVVKTTAKIIISFMVLSLLILIIFQKGHPGIDAFLANNLELIIGVFLAILVKAAGITMGTPRYTVYGAGLLLLSVLSRLNIVQFPFVFIISGGFSLIVGSLLLTSFIIKNPIVDPEDINCG